jgi:superfamily II helicase
MVSSTYADRCLRHHLSHLDVSQRDREMLERYLRQSYLWGKTLAWPSQLRGIERLQKGESFALCAPTGSGKTTVAEIAILQGLFSATLGSSKEDPVIEPTEPLVIYLVPSRALAAEVEFKLSQVFEPLGRGRTPIIITGLYGGTDWGPTDAWLTRNTPTILICTYEKGEALLRFMGPSFLNRVSLVILDEAHSVQFNGKYEELQKAESRPLRLEALSVRLFSAVERNRGHIVALSAVAEGIEEKLASWVVVARELTKRIFHYNANVVPLDPGGYAELRADHDSLCGVSYYYYWRRSGATSRFLRQLHRAQLNLTKKAGIANSRSRYSSWHYYWLAPSLVETLLLVGCPRLGHDRMLVVDLLRDWRDRYGLAMLVDGS